MKKRAFLALLIGTTAANAAEKTAAALAAAQSSAQASTALVPQPSTSSTSHTMPTGATDVSRIATEFVFSWRDENRNCTERHSVLVNSSGVVNVRSSTIKGNS